MPNALVTGAGGQDGHYMCSLLVADGYRVTGTIRPGGSEPTIDGVRYLEMDLRDDASVARVVGTAEPDEIYNLGGVSSLDEADADPAACFDVNLGGLERLLAATDRSTKLCQASSALIFGPPDGAVRDESTPLAPVGPYAEAKAAAHELIATERTSGRHAVSAILFNHESPLRSPRFVTRRITRGVADIVSGKADRLVLRNLGASRDWGFAGDYVNAMRAAMAHQDATDFVVATGEVHSVHEFVELAFAIVGISTWRELVDAQTDTPEPCSAGDPTKAKRVLGWRPEITFEGLVEMMMKADIEKA